MTQFRLMQLGDAPRKLGTARQQVHLDTSTVAAARAAFHEA
ncbi:MULTISPECIES: hypothetical protein [unclassified Halomonas]|nr:MULTISPECIES: hypothetical protein [unclassified Halomonas]